MTKNRGKYGQILVRVFQNTLPTPKGLIEFSQADLRTAASGLGLEIRNFPDLIYNLRSRSPLPDVIADAGYTTIEGIGRGRYALTKLPDKVTIPPDTKVIEWSTRSVPTAISDILRVDEQSILSAVRYMRVVDHFLGFRCYHLQGHLRTTGSMRQQLEADELYVGRRRSGRRIIVAIEGKGPKERIGISQIRSTIDAVNAKIPGFSVIPLALQLEAEGTLLLVHFKYQRSKAAGPRNITPARFCRYLLKPKLPNWP